MNAFQSNLAVLAEGRSKRISSWDRTGGNKDYIRIDPGQTAILAQVQGAGCINKTYATVLSMDRLWGRKLLLRMYWDGEDQPSVEVPFVDFYGVTNCVERFFSSLLLAVNPGACTTRTYGYNSYFPMPFAHGMRLEVTNEGESPIPAFWYHIDYEEWDRPPTGLGRFHAQWRRENLTTLVPQSPGLWTGRNLSGAENYVILDAEGRGSYVGCVLSVNNVTGGWWGEGDDMIFIDDDTWPPSIHGTGTEEIFGGGACPNREYAGLYSGFHLISAPDFAGKTGMYRFLAPDPIRFQKRIRVTIEHGHNNDLANDYASVAYWYQTEPHKAFPPLLPVAQRLPIMPASYWRIVPGDREASLRLWRGILAEADAAPAPKRFAEAFALHAQATEAFERQDYERAGQVSAQVLDLLDEI